MTQSGPEATPPKVPQLLLFPNYASQTDVNNHRPHPNPTGGTGRLRCVTSCALSDLGVIGFLCFTDSQVSVFMWLCYDLHLERSPEATVGALRETGGNLGDRAWGAWGLLGPWTT